MFPPESEILSPTDSGKDSKTALSFVNRIAKRKHLVRRGRNDRVLYRTILNNVFKDNFGFESEDQRPKNGNPGQKFYL